MRINRPEKGTVFSEGKASGALCVPLLFLLIATGCADSTDPDGESSSLIRGRLVDTDGRGIAEAEIVLDYCLEYTGDGLSEPVIFLAEGDVLINPGFPRRSIFADDDHVRVWIERYCTNELIITLADTTRDHVPPQISWNGINQAGESVYPGVYNMVYMIETSTATLTDTLGTYVRYLSYQDKKTDEIEANAVTDSSGYFELDQYCLPFGYQGDWVDEGGTPKGIFTVTRFVNVWAVHDSFYNSSVDSVYIDRERGAEIDKVLH